MKNKILSILSIHLIILATYIGITGWMFIKYREPDPIGTGLQQLLCMIVHFILTAIICIVIRMNAAEKKAATISLFLNLGAVVFSMIMYLLLSNILSNFFWSMRR